MIFDGGRLAPELEALLDRGRTVGRVPDVVRARALVRARASLAASRLAAPAPRLAARGTRGLRFAAATSVALAMGVAGAAAALHFRGPPPRETAPPASEEARAALAAPLDDRTQPLVPAGPDASIVKTQRSARSIVAQESYAAELQLLQRAQSAYASGHLRETLTLVARHDHRFPNGRLSEEREALRVRSLFGSGQAEEARRAVSAFTRRFPRSVLLPRLRETVNRAD